MTDLLPEPLTPADCDLRGLEWMPLDVVTIMDSTLFTTSTGDEFKAAFSLWCKSWRQIPAGSLPADEKALAELSRAKNWKKVREKAMHNWVLCSDGRYYHPIVAQKAMEALPSRKEFEHKKSAEAERKARERADRAALFALLREHGEVPAYDTKTTRLREMAKAFMPAPVTPPSREPVTDSTVTTPVTGHAPVTARRGTGTGTGEGQGSLSTLSAPPDGGIPPAKQKVPKAAKEPAPTVLTWDAYSAAYHRRYSADPVRNAKVNGQLSQVVARLGAEEAPLVAAFFLSHDNLLYVRSGHPTDLLLRDCEKLRTEWFTGTQIASQQVSPFQSQRAARMAEAVPSLAASRPQDGRTIDAETRNVASLALD